MKTLKLLALAAFALLFSQCKTATQATQGAPSLLEVSQILDTTASKFFHYADSAKGNLQQAIILTENWLKTMPTVESAANVDSAYLYIKLKSGLKTVFNFNRIGTDGKSLFRGAPSNNAGPTLSRAVPASLHTIKNKKVLIFCPPIFEFYGGVGGLQKIIDYFTSSGLGFDVTVVTGDQCTYQMIDNLKDYGLVILDTHGVPDAFLVDTRPFIFSPLAMTTEAALQKIIDAQLGAGSYDRFISGDLQFNLIYNSENDSNRIVKKSVWMPSKHIASLTGMENTVILGNMCYSGYQNAGLDKYLHTFIDLPIATAFTSIHPISYYGYAFADGLSTKVPNPFAVEMEDSLVRALVKDLDSTGSAYRMSANTEFFYKGFVSPTHGPFFFKHFGADDYSYGHCIDTFTDARDGHVYKAVCIGKQIWMAENLDYNAPGSLCYDNNSANCPIYGKLYDWNTLMQGAAASDASPSGVQGVCPKGWHVPSKAEYDILCTALGDTVTLVTTDYWDYGIAGGKLKSTSSLWNSPNKGATNISGFSALPGGGYDTYNGGTFHAIGTGGIFWTATREPAVANFPYFITLTNITGDVQISASYKLDHALSCRCVKDN